jgi:hypothetical protein
MLLLKSNYNIFVQERRLGPRFTFFCWGVMGLDSTPAILWDMAVEMVSVRSDWPSSSPRGAASPSFAARSLREFILSRMWAAFSNSRSLAATSISCWRVWRVSLTS